MADTPKKGGPKPFDRALGKRLRAHRNASGLSQQRLAGLLGVSFQQLQKYETGVNRMPAGHIVNAARILDVPVSEFFDGPMEKPAPRHVLERHILRLDESILAVESAMKALGPVAGDLKVVRKHVLARRGRK